MLEEARHWQCHCWQRGQGGVDKGPGNRYEVSPHGSQPTVGPLVVGWLGDHKGEEDLELDLDRQGPQESEEAVEEAEQSQHEHSVHSWDLRCDLAAAALGAEESVAATGWAEECVAVVERDMGWGQRDVSLETATFLFVAGQDLVVEDRRDLEGQARWWVVVVAHHMV